MDGKAVRDFLVMLKAPLEIQLFELDQPRNKIDVARWKIEQMAEAYEQAIQCVETVYPEIKPKVGKEVAEPWPVSTIRNRLMVAINFYSQRMYGFADCKACENECIEGLSGCKRRGQADEYCNMLQEAIRCVEVTGTGVPEPPTISLEDLK